MASVVDICNLALSHLGDRATLSSIDPPEGSAQADHCAQFWPIARDEALAKFDWKFASYVVSPAQLEDALQTNPQWSYAYALPADFLVAREMVYEDNAVAILEPGSPLFDTGTIGTGTKVFFAHYDSLSIRYTRRVNDPSKYPPEFVTALSYLLASMLAGPVIKGEAGRKTAVTMRNAWTKLAGEAAVTDANQRRNTARFTPGAIRARGALAGTQIVEDGPYRRELPFWAEG